MLFMLICSILLSCSSAVLAAGTVHISEGTCAYNGNPVIAMLVLLTLNSDTYFICL